MAVVFDPSTDFEDVTDGLEAVTLERRGDSDTAITNALQRSINDREIAESNGKLVAGDVRWHIPVVEAVTKPRLGDVVKDANDDRYTVLENGVPIATVDGTSLPLGTYTRKIRRDTPLLADPTPLSAMIVYPSGMKGGAALGYKVRQAVRSRSGKDILCMSDEAVIDQTTWLLREEFLGRPIIALGLMTFLLSASMNGSFVGGSERLTLTSKKAEQLICR